MRDYNIKFHLGQPIYIVHDKDGELAISQMFITYISLQHLTGGEPNRYMVAYHAYPDESGYSDISARITQSGEYISADYIDEGHRYHTAKVYTCKQDILDDAEHAIEAATKNLEIIKSFCDDCK